MNYHTVPLENPSFAHVVRICAENRQLIAEFDRLTGANLSMKGTPINLMIDDATGKLQHDVAQFVDFVHDYVWVPWVGKLADRAERGIIGGNGDNR